MTNFARFLRWAPLLVAAALLLAPPLRAEPESDWVAWVKTKSGVRHLTRGRLAGAVFWRARSRLMDLRSAELTVLRQLVEERVIGQEARRLGVQVTDADVNAKFASVDAEVRRATNGNRTLDDVIKRDMKTTIQEFRTELRYTQLKERVASHQKWLGLLPANENAKLAQIAVVVTELMKNAQVVYGVPTALQAEPAKLPAGHVAHVNGEPITGLEFGEELVRRLSIAKIKEIIEQECKSVLTMDWALTPEQMDAVIERERAEWLRVRELATQEAFHALPYEDWVRLQYKLDVESLRKDRYYSGLFGLVQHHRRQVTDEEIHQDWQTNRDTIWGERFLVTDFVITFAPGQQALLGTSDDRSYKDALKLANQLLRRIHGGEELDQIIRDVNEKKDATFVAKRIGVRNTGNEVHLYEQAKLLDDKQISRVFETLTEVHVIRRERRVRPPTFEEVEDTIRQRLAYRRAHDWLQELMTDPTVVEIRWPPK